MLERYGAYLFEMLYEVFHCFLIVFVSTADGTIDVAGIPPDLEERHYAPGNVIIVTKKFYGTPYECTVQKKGH